MKLKKKLSALVLAACLGVASLGFFSLTDNTQQGEALKSVVSHLETGSIVTISYVKSGSVSD